MSHTLTQQQARDAVTAAVLRIVPDAELDTLDDDEPTSRCLRAGLDGLPELRGAAERRLRACGSTRRTTRG